jgi:hypothetical protein
VKGLVTLASLPLIYVVPDRFPNDDDHASARTPATTSG